MSPTSSSSSTIYDHLMINFQQQPKMVMRNNVNLSNNIYDNSNKCYNANSQTNCENLLMIKKTQSLPLDQQQRTNRRYTITHITIPEPIVRCSVSNQVYDKAMIQKSPPTSNISSTWKETNLNAKYFPSPISSNIAVKPMDFRPLIINGRRRFTTISSATPMTIIKKKSPSPMNTISFEQKSLFRSIPVNITSNKTAMVVSTVIPSSLSYSSSCSSSATLAALTNAGTVSVPIQVIKTQKNNNNTMSTSTTSTSTSTSTNTSVEGQKGYRYIQRQPRQLKPLLNLKAGNKLQPLPILSDDDDDDDESTKIPSSSSGGGDGNRHNLNIMADSNVLRLIRRYDPVGASTTGIRYRRSLENTRSPCQKNPPISTASLPSNISSSSCSFLPQQQTSTSIHEDKRLIIQPSTPRLQRQKAVHEEDLPPLLPSPTVTNTIRPILKYTLPISRAELNVLPKKTEPLTIEIEPHVPPIITNENIISYPPLITTGTKRVCAAISKSEWDLRSQNDLSSPSEPSTTTLPVRPPSPRTTINQQQKTESYRPLLSRSKSSMGINNEQDKDIDDLGEKSAPVTAGSCVNKLKQIFNTKPSLDLTNSSITKQERIDSIESNLNRRLHNTHGTNITKSDLLPSTTPLIQKVPNSTSIELQTRTIPNDNLTKPTTVIPETISISSPLIKRPVLRSQKTLDSTESLNRLNHSNTMPSSELSYDAYRFRRLNDHDQMTTTRLRNVAKVEPYSINTNMVRPLYQTSPSLQPTSTTIPSKGRIILNSMGNTPTNSSTSSSAASLGGTIRHPNVRHSDFLTPNPVYSTAPAPHTSQPLFNSSYTTPPTTLLSESLSHGSTHRLPNTTNSSLYNKRSTGLVSSTNNSPQKYQSSTQGDFHPGKQTYSPSTYQNGNSTIINNNNNKYNKFDTHNPPSSYPYRSKDLASSTTALNTSLTNGRQPPQGPIRSTIVEQQPPDERSSGGQQSRRRFQRRKQMKRSKSADLYQEHSSIPSKNPNTNNYLFTTPPDNNNDFNRSNRQPRSRSRDLIGGDEHLSSSSTSSSSIAHIERINRAALLRYKSLDSMTFNNKKSNLNGKTNHRRTFSKSNTIDFDSDDSVCGIPKPRKTTGR